MGSAGSSPKTFQCTGYPGCNMVFTRSEHLARHERKHTGEKPYRCIVANCPRVFSRYDNMIQHTQTHSDRSKRDSLVPGSSGASRTSSVQSTPLISGRARGGSSPVIFGPGYDDHRYSQHNSPAGFVHSPAFGQHQHQQHSYPYQTQQHPMQWTLPSGAPASSPSLMASRSSISHIPGRDGGDSPQQQQNQGMANPSRTLKVNSRSLPQLQPRDSPGGNVGDSPSLALQHGMSSMEIEEIKRRKSEILLPSTISGSRAASMYNRGQVGLGMTPFTPSTGHPGSLSQVEKLSQQEQARLKEHRRSAQAMMVKMNASTGSIDSRPQSTLSHVKHLTAQEKGRLLEHRRSTPELMYESNMKRNSNDDIAVQPLPSRDARSGMQWFSQVNPSPPSGNSTTQVSPSPEQTSALLPPLLGNYNQADQPRTRHYSSHIHPLSRDGSISTQDPKAPPIQRSIDPFLASVKESQFQHQYAPIQKIQVVDAIERMDPAQFDDLKAKATITFANEHVRNPLFLGNIVAILSVLGPPTGGALGIKRGSDSAVVPQKTQGDMEVDEVELDKEHKDSMQLDSDVSEDALAKKIKTEPSGDAGTAAATMTVSPPLDQATCRFALDIDVDSFRRDPGPVLRNLNELTISTHQTITSFVSGFEPAMIGNGSGQDLGHDEEEKGPGQSKSPMINRHSSTLKSTGYPSHHVRLGRFYMPVHAYPVQGAIALVQSLGSEDLWRTCEFKEYPGVSIWVPERVLARYRELMAEPGNNMALTLAHPQEQTSPTLSTAIKENSNDSTGSKHASHRTSSDVSWTSDMSASSDGSRTSSLISKYAPRDRDTALVPESMLHREMIAEVWADMYRKYAQHQQQVQYQQRQEQQQEQPQHQYFQPPSGPSSQSRVATFEEHQRSLTMEQQRRESPHVHHPQAQEHYRHHPYPVHYPQRHHPYAPRGSVDYHHERHHYPHEQNLKQEPHEQMWRREGDDDEEMSEELRHRVLDRRGVLDREHRQVRRHQDEDDEDDEEDNETNDNDDEDEGEEGEGRDRFSSRAPIPSTSSFAYPPPPRDANMLRRISIAELCNPMKSLATERQRQP
ncbi:Up in starvation [Podila horticola]|nr:Up in starvation [Podila horticola]